MRTKPIIWTFLALATTCSVALAQPGQQVWLDYQVDYPFANRYLLEAVGSSQTILTNQNKWRNLGLTPTFEFVAVTKLDLTFDMPLSYTIQSDTVNSVGIDPTLGFRFHITQNKRIDSRFVFRWERRSFKQVNSDEWEKSNRVRLKLEMWISLNAPSLFTDKLWYAVVDYEEFLITDQALDERFSSRRRGRVGIGYRKDYRNRFELFYGRQASRNEIDESFNRDNNIVSLRYKMYLNPPRQAPSR